MFVVPKKDGGWRPVIDLKWLKAFLNAPHFWMDSSGCGGPSSWQNRSSVGEAFEYMVLPFSLCLAPLIFTLVMKPLQAFLHGRGIHSVFYLDNILIPGSSREECLAHLTTALRLLSSGLCRRAHEVSLVPAQRLRFLGFNWDSPGSDVARPSQTPPISRRAP